MFFPRLRRQAKWIYILIAIVFAISFAALGVGTGASGIGDLFSNGKIFGLGGASSSGGPSVAKAQQAIAAHPDRPQGYRDLATAYEGQKQNDLAIAALVKYTTLRPKDQDALRELAGLYIANAQAAQTAAQQAQLANPAAASSQSFQVSGKVGTALGADPILSALSTQVNTAVQAQVTKIQVAQQQAIGVYRQLTRAAPNDPQAWIDLASNAQSLGDNTTAISAYKQAIKLEPASSDVPLIKQRIKQLGG